MRRKALFAVALLLPLFSLVSIFPVNAQETPSATIWRDPIAITDEGTITQQEATNPAHCQITDIRYRKVRAPLQSVGGQLSHSPLQEEQSEPLARCVTTNNQGAFAGEFFAENGDVSKMMRVSNTRGNAMLHPAPGGNAVIISSDRGSQPGRTLGINYNFVFGGLDYFQTTADRYDIDWKLKSLAESLRYSGGEAVVTEGIEFSANGAFMVLRLGTTFVRVNTKTQEITPFYYRSSVSSQFSMTISSDGRYGVTYSNGELFIHDISTCLTTYGKDSWQKYTQTTNPAGCSKSRNFYGDLFSAIPGYGGVRKLEFSPVGDEITFAMSREYQTNRFEWKKVSIKSSFYTPAEKGYLAMGDSYSSGEGDTEGGTWYEPGTDEQGDKGTFAGRNLCHLSRRSYPYLIALNLGYLDTNAITPPADGLFHSVACSGAKIHNITGIVGEKHDDGNAAEFSITDNQYRFSENSALNVWQPGATSQTNLISGTGLESAVIRDSYKPEVVTLGISGNDIGFGDFISDCSLPGICEYAYTTSEKSRRNVQVIAQTKQRLVSTFKKIKNLSPGTRIYVHGYPKFIEPAPDETCGGNVSFEFQERLYIDKTIHYLNQSIQAAAQEVGVFYVDVENIFNGRMLCSELSSGETRVVNGITAGDDVDPGEGTSILGVSLSEGICVRNCIGQESYHPTADGFELYKNTILAQTTNLTEPMPAATPTLIPVPDVFFGELSVNAVNDMNGNNQYPNLIYESDAGIIDELEFNSRRMKLVREGLQPGTTAEVVMESTPVSLGTFTVPDNGRLEIELRLPQDIDGGAHEVHIFGTNSAGRPVDVYEGFIVSLAENDYDGDGESNDIDSCPTLANRGVDYDKDGVDDVCDAEIGEPPADPEPPTPPVTEKPIATIIRKIIKLILLLFSRWF